MFNGKEFEFSVADGSCVMYLCYEFLAYLDFRISKVHAPKYNACVRCGRQHLKIDWLSRMQTNPIAANLSFDCFLIFHYVVSFNRQTLRLPLLISSSLSTICLLRIP